MTAYFLGIPFLWPDYAQCVKESLGKEDSTGGIRFTNS